MSKIDREFLVPFLHDLCSLYLADKKLELKIAESEREINQLQIKEVARKPERPRMEDDRIGCFGFGALAFAVIGVIIMLGPLFDPDGLGDFPAGFFGAIVIALGGFVFYGCYSAARSAKRNNLFAMEEYEEKMSEYIKITRMLENRYEMNQKRIPSICETISELNKERVKLNEVIHRVYQANIIPSYYRNIYVAVYLYDYFSTGRSNDIDMALSLFVLEQIKDRLDTIIEQQQEVILNQRIIMANQQQEAEERREHYEYMKKKADQIANSAEEHSQYLAMIESNTAATAYFAAASYFKIEKAPLV